MACAPLSLEGRAWGPAFLPARCKAIALWGGGVAKPLRIRGTDNVAQDGTLTIENVTIIPGHGNVSQFGVIT
jgi:hypothetical protein